VDPFTIMMLIGAGVSLVSGLAGDSMSVDAAKREAALNGAELERSANLELAKGVDAIRQGQIQAGNARMRTGALRGEQAVGYAKAGIDSSTGTAADVGMYTERIGELDAATIENNAVRAAFGFKETARGLRRQAQAGWENARAAETKSVFSGIGRTASAVGSGADALKKAPKGG
jgi:hypothetical protein